MDLQSDEFLDAFYAQVRARAAEGPLRLELDAPEALNVVAQLQLALRHPFNTGESAAWTRALVWRLIDSMAMDGPLRVVLEAGFDPVQDVLR